MPYEDIPGSGRLHVTSRAVLRRATESAELVKRQEEEETWSDVFQARVSAFWDALVPGIGYSPWLLERVWVANRCLQLNSQQVGSMPLRFFGSREPAWVSNPDPVWYPNGIGDAVFAAVWSIYGWGDAFLYATAEYENGFPSGWTVLHPEPMDVTVRNGKRRYRSGQTILDPDRMVQISRNPGGVRGDSALHAYGSYMNGLMASSELARVMTGEGGTPNAVLKTKRKLDERQARSLQRQWADGTAVRRGAPAVLGPDVDFEQLSFSPADLLLLEVQQFDAQVIASAFGVPPYMVNLPLEGGLTYQSPSMLGEHWWRFELLPVAVKIARALSSNWLPRGNWVEFDARATLAPSFQDAVKAWVMLEQAGIVSTDEVRAAILSLPPASQGEALAELTTPPSASASPAQSASVVALRPTS